MEILEPAPVECSFEFTCTGCKAQLRADADDVRFGHFGVRDKHEPRFYVTCPVCEELRFLDESTIPAVIRQRAMKEKG